jgi:O-antigen ligase
LKVFRIFSEFLGSLFSAALVLVALLIPINPSASAWAMFLAFCAWLLAGRWSLRLPQKQSLSRGLPIFLLYVLAVFGLSWSSVPESGWDVLRVQLSLFLVPMMVLTRPVNSLLDHQYPRIVRAFVAGNLVAMAISAGRALYRFAQSADPDVLSYGELVSWLNLHPAYCTLYAGLAVLLLLADSSAKHRLSVGQGLVFSFLIIYLFLLNSRGTLFAFLIAFVGYTGWLWWFQGQRKRFAVTLLWVLALGSAFSFGLPNNRARMQSLSETRQVSIEEGTASLRLEIWKGAWQTLLQEPLSGYGTGSVRENLVKTYGERGFQAGVDAAFNAHNQYLQTWLMLGLPGLLLLLFLLGQLGLDGWRDRQPERTAAMVFLAMAMFSEAMLERQMGVLPIALFTALWSIYPSPKPLNSLLQGASPDRFPDSSPAGKAAG